VTTLEESKNPERFAGLEYGGGGCRAEVLSQRMAHERIMRVFVFLGHGFGAKQWEERWQRDSLPGRNERLPYGYFHAANDCCRIIYSEDQRENGVTRLVRRLLRRLAGFDLIHAWRNRRELQQADVVWTYTELEHLAVLTLWRLLRTQSKPRVIAQCVWLIDQWPRLSVVRRRFYAWLLEDAEILAVQSPDGVVKARESLPKSHVEWLPFGTSCNTVACPESHSIHSPLRIASLGNDVDRDWCTLFTAIADISSDVRIASTRLRLRTHQIPRHVAIERPQTASAIDQLYQWADIVVVSLRPNLHASGITTICEAILAGIPVVCSDAGGLRAYFSDREVQYVPPGDPMALRRALEQMAASPDDRRFEMVKRAQHRIETGGFTSAAFAARNYQWSLHLLGIDQGGLDETPVANFRTKAVREIESVL
jgi:glycosyltransferase involved in cell wall biosynthesis